jgi:hypothetical protein
MFNQLFFRSDALTRQLSAPLIDERRRYLAHCATQGMSRRTLRIKARLLLSIAEYLELSARPNDTIDLPEIKKAASRWSSHNWPSSTSSYAKLSRKYFITQAAGWLSFLNRLQTVPKPVKIYDQILAEFRSFMKEHRGLSPTTVECRCNSVRPFLEQLLDGKRSLETITVSDVDSLLAQKVNKEHYARISIPGYASSLRRSFDTQKCEIGAQLASLLRSWRLASSSKRLFPRDQLGTLCRKSWMPQPTITPPTYAIAQF